MKMLLDFVFVTLFNWTWANIRNDVDLIQSQSIWQKQKHETKQKNQIQNKNVEDSDSMKCKKDWHRKVSWNRQHNGWWNTLLTWNMICFHIRIWIYLFIWDNCFRWVIILNKWYFQSGFDMFSLFAMCAGRFYSVRRFKHIAFSCLNLNWKRQINLLWFQFMSLRAFRLMKLYVIYIIWSRTFSCHNSTIRITHVTGIW